nr:protein ABHD12B [Delphinus delphis]
MEPEAGHVLALTLIPLVSKLRATPIPFTAVTPNDIAYKALRMAPSPPGRRAAGRSSGLQRQLPQLRPRWIGLRCGVETDKQGCVTAWWYMVAQSLRHTVPSCRGEDAKGKSRSRYEAALHDGNPIIVYLHGSAEHRTAPHRLEIVKVLSDGGFHVSSVDYRGFGDSTGKLTEDGLTSDAICVYEWTKARSGTTPVCLWGHSLGTGVTTNAAKVLEGEGFPVDTIILEAPFTNIWVASINYPLLKIYQKLPGFLSTVMDALRKEELVSLNDENVKFLSSPLLIIHGEDDKMVPLEFGKKLYEISHNPYRNKERVKIVIFPPGFQHNFLCKSSTLLKTRRDFLSQQWA